jgi:hypothetical protein
MPFTDDTTFQGMRQPIGQPSNDPFLHPAPELMGAAFRQYNPIMWAIDAFTQPTPDHVPTPGYRPPVESLSRSHYEPYLSQFLGDVNPAQTDARMAKIDRDLRDQGLLAASGEDGTVVIIAATIANPLWLLLIWVALRLWKQHAAIISAEADFISSEAKKDSFQLLILVIVSVRKAWKSVSLNFRLVYEHIRDAVQDAENHEKR